MKIKLNPIGLTSASFMVVLGAIVCQVIGVTMAFPYTLPIMVVGGLTFGFVSYKAYKSSSNDVPTFFRRLAIAMASMLGGFLGGATVGPFLLIFATLIPPNILLVLTILASSLLFGVVAFVLDKIVHALVKKFKPQFKHSPWSFVLWSTVFVCMVLGGSLGISLGLFGWGSGLLVGAGIGVVLGLINHFVNPNPVAAKVLSNLFAISGLLGGVMLGVIINAFLPAPILFLGCITGAVCMLIAAYVGNKIGKNIVKDAFKNNPDDKEAQQKYFDLNNPKLRQALYAGALLIPTLCMGYLTGGLLGFHIASFGANILLFQAYGTAVAGAVYASTLGAYMGIKKLFFKKEEAATPPVVVSNHVQLSPVVEPSPIPPSPVLNLRTLCSARKDGEVVTVAKAEVASQDSPRARAVIG